MTVLRALPIFETLDDECLRPLMQVAMLRSIPRHTVVLNAGDSTDNIYFVLSGALKVQVGGEDGRDALLRGRYLLFAGFHLHVAFGDFRRHLVHHLKTLLHRLLHARSGRGDRNARATGRRQNAGRA